METKVVYYKDTTADVWDNWVKKVGGGTSYYHSYRWINYAGCFSEVRENSSFVVLGKTGEPIAVCPLAFSILSDSTRSISFGYTSTGAPVVKNGHAGEKRECLDKIFEIYKNFALQNKAQKIIFSCHPLDLAATTPGAYPSAADSFVFLRYGLQYQVENTLVIDLSLPAEELTANLGKYHHRHIKRGSKKGLVVKIYNRENNSGEMEKRFAGFEEAHLLAAGRSTRPQETWQAMLEELRVGEASLFVTFLGDLPLSYLFCGEFGGMAFGWSQANIKEYEEEYSPRHILEWEAMMFYKKQGFKFYEVGERFFGPQLFHVPTEKEISIGVFKERYGGFMLPKVKWTGYFDLDLMKKEISGQTNKFFEADPVFRTSSSKD